MECTLSQGEENGWPSGEYLRKYACLLPEAAVEAKLVHLYATNV